MMPLEIPWQPGVTWERKQTTGTKSERRGCGQKLAQARKSKITKASFDRGAYKYHGRVKAWPKHFGKKELRQPYGKR